MIDKEKCRNYYYNGNVYNLGEFDEKLNDISSTIDDQSIVTKFIQEQFTKNAQAYSEKYTNFSQFETLIINSLSKINLRPKKILDIGSGSGNTVIPLIKLFPDSEIIASDLSIELLYLLKQNLISNNKISDNIHILQLNAENLNFNESTFDLVIGASILHHLFSPEKTIESAYKILNDNGFLIFYEPFENGNMIIRIIFEEILKDRRSIKIPFKVKNFLKAIITDYDFRKGSDKSNPHFSQMDDKWLFTKNYINELSEKCGYSKCSIYPLHETEKQFENQISVLLKLGLGLQKEVLPKWAWEKIKEYDKYFSEDMKKDLIIEGCIILKK